MILLKDHLIRNHFKKEINGILSDLQEKVGLGRDSYHCPLSPCGYFGQRRLDVMKHIALTHGYLSGVISNYRGRAGLSGHHEEFLNLVVRAQPNHESGLTVVTCEWCKQTFSSKHLATHQALQHFLLQYSRRLSELQTEGAAETAGGRRACPSQGCKVSSSWGDGRRELTDFSCSTRCPPVCRPGRSRQFWSSTWLSNISPSTSWQHWMAPLSFPARFWKIPSSLAVPSSQWQVSKIFLLSAITSSSMYQTSYMTTSRISYEMPRNYSLVIVSFVRLDVSVERPQMLENTSMSWTLTEWSWQCWYWEIWRSPTTSSSQTYWHTQTPVRQNSSSPGFFPRLTIEKHNQVPVGICRQKKPKMSKIMSATKRVIFHVVFVIKYSRGRGMF